MDRFKDVLKKQRPAKKEGGSYSLLAGESTESDPFEPPCASVDDSEQNCINCNDHGPPMSKCYCRSHRKSVATALQTLRESVDARLQTDKEELSKLNKRKYLFPKAATVMKLKELEDNIGRLKEVRGDLDYAEKALVEGRESILWANKFLGLEYWKTFVTTHKDIGGEVQILSKRITSFINDPCST